MAKPFTVTRSTEIAAPADAIYPLLSDFRRWPQWSPWERLDPAMEHVYEGTESGAGAIHRWRGNRKAGEGRAEITAATEPSEVVRDLEFLKPFKARNVVTYTLEPAGEGTRVTWRMDGELNLSRALGLRWSPMQRQVRWGSALASAQIATKPVGELDSSSQESGSASSVPPSPKKARTAAVAAATRRPTESESAMT